MDRACQAHRELRDAVRVVVGLRIAHAQHRQHRFEAGRRVDLEIVEGCGNLRAPLVQLALHVGHRAPGVVHETGASQRVGQSLTWEGFDEVVGNARLQTVDGRVELEDAGRHQHDHLGKSRAQLVGEPETVVAREADVAQRDRRCSAGLRQGEPLFCRTSLDDGGAFGLDPVPQQFAQRLFVVNDQYAHPLVCSRQRHRRADALIG
jgi:hypothetical protein